LPLVKTPNKERLLLAESGRSETEENRAKRFL